MDASNTACTASTTSLVCGEVEETHEKGRQNDCEYDSIIVPERICSEHKKDWMDQIRQTCTTQEKEDTFGASD
jgi:hypothetical protein